MKPMGRVVMNLRDDSSTFCTPTPTGTRRTLSSRLLPGPDQHPPNGDRALCCPT